MNSRDDDRDVLERMKQDAARLQFQWPLPRVSKKGSSGPSDAADAVGRGIARGYPKPLGVTRCVSGRPTLMEEGRADSEAGILNN